MEKVRERARIKTELLEKYLQDNKITKSKFAELVGVNRSSICRAMDNLNTLTMTSALKVCRILNCKLDDLYTLEDIK